MSDQTQTPNPEQMAELVKGLSDDELAAQIKELGTDEVVKSIFDAMPQSFIP